MARCFGRLGTVLVSLNEALSIGVLQSADIDAAVSQSYRKAPTFYDPERYGLELEEEILPLLYQATQGRRLLDLYAGQGREAEIFARAGYDVLGVEGISSCVEKAKLRAERGRFSAEFITADITEWEPQSKDWDVVYTSLWMYSCTPDRNTRISWLKRVAGFTSGNGVLVVSTMPRLNDALSQWRYRFAKVIARLSFNCRRPELGDRFERGLFWHDFRHDEVVDELDRAGLSLVDVHKTLAGNAPPCTFYLVRRNPEAQC